MSQNPRLASRYAKSLIDLAVEMNELEAVNKDIEFLQSLIKISPEFRTVLSSPIIKPSKKTAILSEVTKNRLCPLSSKFFQLLLTKHREAVLPEIVTAFKEQYNLIKGISKVKITTAAPLSEGLRSDLLAKLKAETNMQTIELDARVDEELIGGFVLEYNNNIVDASILYDLKAVRKQFLSNEYIYNIR